MVQPAVVARCGPEGFRDTWKPTTLDQLGKSEEYFEDVLAASPELLCLETRRSGISGPFQIFRQLEMETPSGRMVYPDIVLLAASGHVVVVEVKRYVNPELRDRAVIAQIIDYASSFAALSEERLAALFGSGKDSLTWGELVDRMFPDDRDSDELAEALLNRIHNGQLNLVIACDKIPAGLPAIVAGIASQETLGFDLDLVEITPFVREVSESAEIILVPSSRLVTEIVARTAVTVTYRQGDEPPSVNVKTTSIQEIIDDANSARKWTPQEVEDAFIAWKNPVALELLEFAKKYSAGGQFVAPGPKQNATFVFYISHSTADGSPRKQSIFNCVKEWGGIYLYLNGIAYMAPTNVLEDFRKHLQGIFGDAVDVNMKEPGLSFDLLSSKLPQFKELILWLKAKIPSS